MKDKKTKEKVERKVKKSDEVVVVKRGEVKTTGDVLKTSTSRLEAWQKDYPELEYIGTAVSTTTSGAAIEATFGIESDYTKEWKAKGLIKKYCENCQESYESNFIFCPKCGNKLEIK